MLRLITKRRLLFTGKLDEVTVNASGELIKDEEAEIDTFMVRQ
jgi:hypothetical protein